MRQFIYDCWNGVMNAKHNPLKNIQDLQVRHMALQALAWMWCIAFSIMIGDLMFFGTSLIAHTACLLYTSPSPRDRTRSRMPSSA